MHGRPFLISYGLVTEIAHIDGDRKELVVLEDQNTALSIPVRQSCLVTDQMVATVDAQDVPSQSSFALNL